MTSFERYAAPRSLEEAADMLRGGNATLVAGGTDLMVQTRAGRVKLRPLLVNIRRVPELQGIEEHDGTARIGALVTITELLESAFVRERLNLLWQACDHFASDQIRNAATVGGNLCNASPAGDTLVPLLALDAQAVLASKPDGALEVRRVPLNEFFAGPGRTCKAPREIVTAVEIPIPDPGFRGEFYKHGTRPGLDISTISIAAGARLDGKVLRDVRIALGAVAPTPVRAAGTEKFLEGRVPGAEAIATAARVIQDEIHPISDVRASDWYRRELVANMLKRTLAHVCQL
jgi:CO/xanthine dehydrogenase FAD-binding subunit